MKKVDCIIIEKDDLTADGKSYWDLENYNEIKYYNIKSDPAHIALKSELVFLKKKDGSLHLLKNRYIFEL